MHPGEPLVFANSRVLECPGILTGRRGGIPFNLPTNTAHYRPSDYSQRAALRILIPPRSFFEHGR